MKNNFGGKYKTVFYFQQDVENLKFPSAFQSKQCLYIRFCGVSI